MFCNNYFIQYFSLTINNNHLNRYVGKEDSTNMVIVDIKLLSGFVPEPQSLRKVCNQMFYLCVWIFMPGCFFLFLMKTIWKVSNRRPYVEGFCHGNHTFWHFSLHSQAEHINKKKGKMIF